VKKNVMREVTSSPLLVFIIGSMTLVSRAHAEAPEPPKTASLSWLRSPGAEQCVTTQALAVAIEEKLAKKVFVSPSNADLSVEGQVEAKKKELNATIVVRDRKGEKVGVREFHSSDLSCGELGKVLPLAIALMIDPDAEEHKHESEVKSEPKPEPKPTASEKDDLATLRLPLPPEVKSHDAALTARFLLRRSVSWPMAFLPLLGGASASSVGLRDSFRKTFRSTRHRACGSLPVGCMADYVRSVSFDVGFNSGVALRAISAFCMRPVSSGLRPRQRPAHLLVLGSKHLRRGCSLHRLRCAAVYL
jgi:hypothetical protein